MSVAVPRPQKKPLPLLGDLKFLALSQSILA